MRLVCQILSIPLVFLFLLAFGWLFVLAWAFGTPFTVRRSKRVVGHIRWFKFTPVKDI
jgi:hypothetical protein